MTCSLKTLRLLGLLALSAPSLHPAGLGQVTIAIPERPGIPIVHFNGQKAKVIAFRGTDAMIMDKGAARSALGMPISIIPGDEFGPGLITIERSHAGSVSIGGRDSDKPTNLDYTAFYAKVVADRDLSDVFLVFLVYEASRDGKYDEVPRVSLQGLGIGKLEAGKARTIDTNFRMLSSSSPLRWTALFFSGGSQIRTTEGNEVLDGLFEMIDRAGLLKVIGERSSGDYPLMIYRHFPLSFRDAEKTKFAGRTVDILIKIAPTGYFDSLVTEGVHDQFFADSIARQLSFWLFIPPIKDGVPQAASIVLPIKF
jgi:hypothetical protein